MSRYDRLSAALLRGLLWCLVWPASLASAHPHVWIAYTASIRMENTSIVALDETWRFTEGFPVQLAGIDQLPANGLLSAAQTQQFHDQAFVSLAHAFFFTHLFVDGNPQTFGEPTGFKVSVADGKITYAFRLPLAAPVDIRGKQVELGVWDPSYYVDYEAQSDGAVAFAPGAPASCSVHTVVDKAHPIFNGFVLPHASALTC
ncbi:DUF1007 family protein [Paraburkholderia sp. B3]|uniref:DUF1007 family protein n=1 Tax=Paraburkholderia sp. B3 TaxID=3134791 RepID=UPI0039823017